MSTTTPRVLTALTSLLAAALIAGCSSDSPTNPSSQSLDLASVFSQMSIGNVNAIPGASVALSLPATATPPAIVPSACSYSAASGSFTCPPVTAGGLTFTMSYYLYDASGHAQSQPDPSTTASVRTVTDASGTVGLPTSGVNTGSTIALTSHQDMTLSGLLTNTRTLNGGGKSHYDFASAGTQLLADDTTTTANVVLPESGGASKWPQSGTITTDMTTSATGVIAGNFTTHSVITFNGTSTITVAVLSGVLSTTCAIDLTGKTPVSCTDSATGD